MKIRAKLDVENNLGHRQISEALDILEETYLQPGYQERMSQLVPRDDIVFSHNDLNELNILLSR